MSMARCPHCGQVVDTDDDLLFYGPDSSERPEACESCREEKQIDRDEEYRRET
jgi:hypothetical protein